MRISKSTGFALILLTGACASTPGGRMSRQIAKEPLRGGVAEFQVTSYNGENVEGRILLGATIDPLVIDGRLIETWSVDVDVRTVRACGKKDIIGALEYDLFPRPPRQDQIITIRPGYWYGSNIRYWFFDKDRPGPECVEAEFVVRALDGREAATVRIHAVRTDKTPAPPDGGAPAEPKPVTPGAGAP